MNRWTEVYIGLGGNVGNRRRTLEKTLALLDVVSGLRVETLSPLYETSPIGPRQRPFYNAVLRARTKLAPLELLAALQAVEKAAGRRKAVRWGPRAADLDILTYGRRRIRSRRLTVPHPELSGRRFVLEPWKDIAPGFRPPGHTLTVKRLAARLTDPAQKVKLIKGALRRKKARAKT